MPGSKWRNTRPRTLACAALGIDLSPGAKPTWADRKQSVKKAGAEANCAPETDNSYECILCYHPGVPGQDLNPDTTKKVTFLSIPTTSSFSLLWKLRGPTSSFKTHFLTSATHSAVSLEVWKQVSCPKFYSGVQSLQNCDGERSSCQWRVPVFLIEG